MAAYPLHFPSESEALITLSNPSSYIWVIELHNGVDNRLTKHFLQEAFAPALDHVEIAWRIQWETANQAGRAVNTGPGSDSSTRSAIPQNTKTPVLKKFSDGCPPDGRGALVITGNLKQEKFFSNGLDLDDAAADPDFFLRVFHPWIARLMTFPIPVVAAINGHAFAGGWILSATADYRVMSGGKCWASMNEVRFGSAFPYTTLLFLRTRFPSLTTMRRLVQEGHLWTPKELLQERMIDYLVEPRTDGSSTSQRVLQKALEVAESRCGDARSGVYGLIKKSLAKPVLDFEHYSSPLIRAVDENAAELYRLKARMAQRQAKL